MSITLKNWKSKSGGQNGKEETRSRGEKTLPSRCTGNKKKKVKEKKLEKKGKVREGKGKGGNLWCELPAVKGQRQEEERWFKKGGQKNEKLLGRKAMGPTKSRENMSQSWEAET